MALRRQRKQLTNVIYTVDRRLRNLEFMQIKGSSATVTEPYDNLVDQPPAAIAANSNPSPWSRIIGGYYYPSKVTSTGTTGNTDRVELYLNSDPGLAKGDSVTVSGVRVTNIDVSKDSPYKVITAGGATGANVAKSWYHAPIAGTTNTIYYTAQQVYNGSSVSIPAKALISSVSATNTTVTVVFTAAHNFLAGDVIDVADLGAVGTTYNEIDNYYQVASVPSSTTLTYTFYTSKASSTASTSPVGKYIYPVLNSTTNLSDTWIDTSQTPAVTYYWNGVRWTPWLLGAVTTDGDGVAPGPPTALSYTTSGSNATGKSTGTYSKVVLTWVAPTTNEKGAPLKDLAGYEIWYKKTASSTGWITAVYSADLTQTIDGLEAGVSYDFRVYSLDVVGNKSKTYASVTVMTGVAALAFTSVSTPLLGAPRLGTITIKWDGKDAAGAVIPLNLLGYIEVHVSATSGFTPVLGDVTTLKGTLRNSNDSVIAVDLAYNTVYYVRFIGVDIAGNATTPSLQATSAKILPLVDADLIAAAVNAPLSYWPFKSGAVTAGALASGAISASNMFGINVIYQSAIAANAIGANQIAAGAIIAGKLTANSVVAGNISALAVSADNIQANAITADKILAGSISAIKIASNTITGDNINANTSITFTDNAANSAIIGNHIVAGYSGNVTITGISLYRSSTRSGIVGAGTWADFSAGADEITNALSYVYVGLTGTTRTYDAYLRANGGIQLNSVTGTNVYGQFLMNGGSYNQGGIHAYLAPIRVYYANVAAFVLWPNSTYSSTPTSTAAKNAALLYADTTNMILLTQGSTVTSTRNSKEDINPYPMDLRILDINPVTFRYKNPGGKQLSTQLGLIAEDVADLGLDAIVTMDPETNSPIGIDYAKIPVLLAPIVKNLSDRINELEKKVLL